MIAGGGSYLYSGCPLDTDGSGVCTGPCTAFIDFDGDGFCDRLPAPLQVAEAGDNDTLSPSEHTCPFGLSDDPFPGLCNLYIDKDGDGICDLSQSHSVKTASASIETSNDNAAELSPPTSAIITACPLGLVNDPYPGECRRYVDRNGNGICDLSEPELVANNELKAPPVDTPEHLGEIPSKVPSENTGGQRQRRGQNK